VQPNNPRTHSSEIRVVDLSTSHTHTLSIPGADHLDGAPAWFPDGTRPAFPLSRTGPMEIWVMAADGPQPRQLTGLPRAGAPSSDKPRQR
jgi:Tol biopolymer transport system component